MDRVQRSSTSHSSATQAAQIGPERIVEPADEVLQALRALSKIHDKALLFHAQADPTCACHAAEAHPWRTRRSFLASHARSR